VIYAVLHYINSVHYQLNPPVNFTFLSVIKQHVLLNLTRMTRIAMKAESQMPCMGKIKKTDRNILQQHNAGDFSTT
jgi:hypothetical protein